MLPMENAVCMCSTFNLRARLLNYPAGCGSPHSSVSGSPSILQITATPHVDLCIIISPNERGVKGKGSARYRVRCRLWAAVFVTVIIQPGHVASNADMYLQLMGARHLVRGLSSRLSRLHYRLTFNRFLLGGTWDTGLCKLFTEASWCSESLPTILSTG
jgi:hypothetical protein